MPPMTGRVIAGRYSLASPIGRGAMGVVWRARDLLLDRDVAVKEVVLSGAIGEEEQANAHQRTLREARTAARLSHRGVVTIYDVAEEDGRPWIVMELVPSRSLDQVLAADGPLTARHAGRMGEQLLAALAAAHAAGVLHRDVKPSNVLIATEGLDAERAVLTDFGIAQFEGDPRLTQTGMVMGSPGFTAPERIRGSSATPASDLWSLGATIYAAVEGRGPYEQRGGAITTMTAIINEDAPVAASAGPLGPVIAALLRRNPDARPTASAAARMIAEVLPALSDDRSGLPPQRTPTVISAARGMATVPIAEPSAEVPPAKVSPAEVSHAEVAAAAESAQVARARQEDALKEAAAPGSGRTAVNGSSPVNGASPAKAESPAEAATPDGAAASAAAPTARFEVPGPSFSPAPPLPAGPWPSSPEPPQAVPAGPPTMPQPRPPHGAPGRRVPSGTGSGRRWRPRRSMLATLAALLVLAAAAAVATDLITRHVLAAPKASSPASGSVQPAAVQAIDSPSSAIPAGWTRETVEPSLNGTHAGFSMGLPPGWQPDQQALATFLDAPDGVRYVDVDLTPHAYPGNMVAEAHHIESESLAKDSFPGYKRLSIRPVKIRDTSGAIWSFTWVSPKDGVMRVDDLLFVLRTAGGSQSYAVYVTAPKKTFGSSSVAFFDKMLRTFHPVTG